MKTCSKCGETKPRDEFHKTKRGRDGLVARCKPCVREAGREATRRHRQKLDPQEVAKRRRELYFADHAKSLEYNRARRAANPEACREATRKSYQKHIEKRRAEAVARKHSITQGCAVEGCDTRATAEAVGSMCDKHIWRLKHWGTTDDTGRMDLTGENSPRWGGDSVGYKSAHHRVYRARGRAAEHSCVDCTSQADQWSYNHDCPRELTGTGIFPNGEEREVRYSPDPYAYSPRCISDHVKYDRNNKSKNEKKAA